jgi:hypothetical protein
MNKLTRVALFLLTTVVAIPTIIVNATTNIRQLPLSSGAQAVTISMTDRSAHLLDFSNSDRTVTGVWVDDPREFAQSFKVESVNNDPKMVAFSGVAGGSSRFTANLITVDADGNQYIQPINLIKRVSAQNITRFVGRPSEIASVPNNDELSSTTAVPPTTTTTPVAAASPTTATPPITEISTPNPVSAPLGDREALEILQGSIAAESMSALVDPELQSRVLELVTAVRSGQDPYRAAQSIGISQQYVTKLIELGKTNRLPSKSATNFPE